MGEDDAPVVGLVGDADGVSAGVREAVGEPVVGDPDAVLEAGPALVVAVGEAAVVSVARQRPTVPILPVDAGAGLRAVPRSAVVDALSRYASDAWRTERHPLLAVTCDGEPAGPALFDVTLVTDEPARISEFAVATADEAIADIRADGIVVATPAGTGGYAHAVGAPIVPPESGVLTVAPIAPFTTDPVTWVLPADGVRVTVQRDEAPVAVMADDRMVAHAVPFEPVSIAPDGAVETVVVPESASPFAPADGELEKH